MHTYIIIEYTCAEYVTSTIKGSSVLDVVKKHKKKRDWLESKKHWYQEDTSEIIAVLKISDNSKNNINLLIEELERYS